MNRIPMFRRGLLAIAMLCPGIALAASAQSPFAFAVFNQAALARHAPLPVSEAATPRAGGVSLSVDWASESVLDDNASEFLRLDGEALRLGFGVHGGGPAFGWSVELPLLVTGGGVLDSTIENWHDWFGLPNGGRELIPQDEYRYRYVRDGQVLLDLEGSDTALGDVRVGLSRCSDLGCLRALLQLPTGDADRLLGGGLGLSVWGERGYAFGGWSGSVAAGIAAVRADGPLEAQQQEFIPFGWLSLGYALTRHVDAGVQFYAHAPLYDDSDLDALAQAGGQLSVGLRVSGPVGTRWRVGFQEDVLTESSPDFVIHLAADWGVSRR